MKVIHLAFTDEQWEEMAKSFNACYIPLTIEKAEECFPEVIVEGLRQALIAMQADYAKVKLEEKT